MLPGQLAEGDGSKRRDDVLLDVELVAVDGTPQMSGWMTSALEYVQTYGNTPNLMG